MSDIPHLAVPMAVAADGSLAVVDQDSDEEIAQTVAVILGTRPGERLMVPDLGVDDPTFTRPDEIPHGLTNAVAAWEPRATVDHIAQALSDGSAEFDVTLARNEV